MIYKSEIKSYADLELYIRQELATQTATGKRRAFIKLDVVWFYKLHKLIQFALKYQAKEEELQLSPLHIKYWTRINGVLTLVERYDGIRGKEDLPSQELGRDIQ